MTERIIELGDKKEVLTKEDLPFIIDDVLGNKAVESKVEILNYSLSVAKGLKSSATIILSFDAISFFKIHLSFKQLLYRLAVK